MDKVTKKQIETLDMLLVFKTSQDERFNYSQGFLSKNAKTDMTRNEANSIIKYINYKNYPKPKSFDNFIKFS